VSERFHATNVVVDHGPGVWATAEVSILEKTEGGDVRIGGYARNHSILYNTFVPFQKNGRWYALYSRHYTATRVMELPSCKDLGGEDPDGSGFCPVDYYVPFDNQKVVRACTGGSFGFVAGCIWGDDSSWKIQYLDLSRIEDGIIERKELFGYIEMPTKEKRLRDCVDLSEYDPPEYNRVRLTIEVLMDLATGRQVDPLS